MFERSTMPVVVWLVIIAVLVGATLFGRWRQRRWARRASAAELRGTPMPDDTNAHMANHIMKSQQTGGRL